MEITSEIIASFRQFLKPYTDPTKWPEDIVFEALEEADAETGSNRWGAFENTARNFKRRGLFYYAAHWMASMYGKNALDPANIDPASRLNVAGKSVGDESVNYRITAMEATGNDWLSTTIYGQQYWRLRRRAGMGAVAV